MKADNIIDGIMTHGRGALLHVNQPTAWLLIIPVHSHDCYLLGMKWQGEYFIDLALPCNLYPAPFIFPSFADLLEWIIKHNSRRVSCRHFLVTPMSPKMASWPWLFLVNLGTSLRQYKLRSICNPGKRGLNRKPNYRKSAKNKEYFDTKIDGKRLICDFSFVFAFTP